MRRIGACVLVLLVAIGLFVAAGAAEASCAPDPGALTFREMIDQGTTGKDVYDELLLGRVWRVRDLGGEKGGRTIARLVARAHPFGPAPRATRIVFWREPPGVSSSIGFEFHRGDRYGVVARRTSSGLYRSDAGCGQTRKITRQRMWRLVRLARTS